MHDPIRRHIEAIGTRSGREAVRLTWQLRTSCWPGGGQDRVDRSALEWLRRWAPATGGGPRLVCQCAHGRCAICN